MDFIRDIGIDLNEIDDAFEIVHDKRRKEQDFIEQLAVTLQKLKAVEIGLDNKGL